MVKCISDLKSGTKASFSVIDISNVSLLDMFLKD